MSSLPKDRANLNMLEKFHKIVVEGTKDVKFVFQSNDNNNKVNESDGSSAPKAARYSLRGKSNVGGDGDDDNAVKILAHKELLAASSPVFNAMFNGKLKETGDVKIIDASPDAFREFLQIFYNNQMKLTMENIEEIMKLIDTYDVEAGWPFVETFLKENLAVLDTLWGLHLAMKFRRNDLITFCTSQIEMNCDTVCDMIEIGSNGKPKIHSNPNARTISDADLATIFPRVFAVMKKSFSKTTNVNANMSLSMEISLEAARDKSEIHDVIFSSNRKLLLTHITYSDIYDQMVNPIEYDIKIRLAEIEMWQRVNRGRIVKLQHPILVQANRAYQLQIHIITKFAWRPTIITFKTPIEPITLTSNTTITFQRTRSIVAGMNFLQCTQ